MTQKGKNLQWLLCFLACLLPLVSSAQEDLEEKQIKVAMRMIGHEILMSMGDCDSRVLPIENIDGHYKISFEFEFGFDPDELATIVDKVMKETQITSDYLVEVEQCETQEKVHSFWVWKNDSMIPCAGRILPEDCYNLIVSLIEENNQTQTTTKTSPSNTKLYTFSFVGIASLLFMGVVFYRRKQKDTPGIDPHHLKIGGFLFDQKNMTLSFDQSKVNLSYKESELLSALYASVNTPLAREVILKKVWGDEGDYIGRTLDVYISKLRKKLELDASVRIVNIRGVGYKLVVE